MDGLHELDGLNVGPDAPPSAAVDEDAEHVAEHVSDYDART